MRTFTTGALCSLSLAVSLSLPASAWSQEKVGVATTVIGPVTVARASMPPATLKFKDDILLRDRVTTGDNAITRILLGGKVVVGARLPVALYLGIKLRPFLDFEQVERKMFGTESESLAQIERPVFKRLTGKPRDEIEADISKTRIAQSLYSEARISSGVRATERSKLAIDKRLHADARAVVARATERYPHSTVVRTVIAPSVEGAAALSRGRFDDALRALDVARSAERGTVAGLVPIYLRAEALLGKGDAAGAIQAYEELLRWRGADPFAPVVPLAYFGLGRAYAQQGNLAKGRAAFDELLKIWGSADEDLPVLRRARAEYDHLFTSTAAASRR